jgi:hypothetical protein
VVGGGFSVFSDCIWELSGRDASLVRVSEAVVLVESRMVSCESEWFWDSCAKSLAYGSLRTRVDAPASEYPELCGRSASADN